MSEPETKVQDESKIADGDGAPLNEEKVSEEKQQTENRPTFEEYDPQVVARLRKVIREGYEIFDKEKKDVIAQEDVTTLMRYLGQFPTERDVVKTILPQMLGEAGMDGVISAKDNEEEHEELMVKYVDFETTMLGYMLEHKYNHDDEDMLLSAFKALDPERKGYIDEDYLNQAMCKMGSAFRSNEYDAFVNLLKDNDTGRLYYHEYVTTMLGQVEGHLKKLHQ